MAPDVLFDLALDHGRCLGLRIPEEVRAVEELAEQALLGEERAVASQAPPLRRRTWVGGRAALRTLLARAGVGAPPLLTDDRGAPVAPVGIAASISHKDSIAVALIAREPVARVGIDLEADVVPRIDVSSRVLADDELAELAGCDERTRAHEVLVRFSAKESLYKALDPFVRRYVAFREISVSTTPDGDARVRARLCRGEGPFAMSVRWRCFDGLVLTTARVEPADDRGEPLPQNAWNSGWGARGERRRSPRRHVLGGPRERSRASVSESRRSEALRLTWDSEAKPRGDGSP